MNLAPFIVKFWLGVVICINSYLPFKLSNILIDFH